VIDQIAPAHDCHFQQNVDALQILKLMPIAVQGMALD
jgi:hypothetical protein